MPWFQLIESTDERRVPPPRQAEQKLAPVSAMLMNPVLSPYHEVEQRQSAPPELKLMRYSQ